jgi:hypothetical protein
MTTKRVRINLMVAIIVPICLSPSGISSQQSINEILLEVFDNELVREQEASSFNRRRTQPGR